MEKLIIETREPIWNGRKNIQFGVARYRMTEEIFAVRCTYKDKQGNQVFPGLYVISKAKAICYRAERERGTWVHRIPIEAFEHREEADA